MLKRLSVGGFGIIESLISIMLLTLLMVGGMSVYTYSNEHLKLMTYQRMAADLANSKMESIKHMGYNFTRDNLTVCPDVPVILPKGIGQLDANISVCRPVVPVLSNCNAAGICNDGGSYGNYSRVEVAVAWVQPGQSTPSNVTLDSFIAE